MESLKVLNEKSIDLLCRNQLLLPLIKSELIKEQIKSTELTNEEKSQLRNSLMASQKIKSKEEYQAWLIKMSINEDEYLNQIGEPIRIQKHSLKTFGHAVERQFLSRKDDLEQITYSLIRVKDRFLANEIYLRINEKEAEFGDLASEYSTGQEKNTKGIIGPIVLTKSHPSLTEVLKTSKVGELNKPFQINDNWLIVRLESFNKAILNQEMELRMSQELFNEWLDENTKKNFDIILSEHKKRSNL